MHKVNMSLNCTVVTWEKFGLENLTNLANYELFAKIFLANSFYLYGSPKISPTKIFPCTVFLLMCVYGCIEKIASVM